LELLKEINLINMCSQKKRIYSSPNVFFAEKKLIADIFTLVILGTDTNFSSDTVNRGEEFCWDSYALSGTLIHQYRSK
jgi:hypothetical protein